MDNKDICDQAISLKSQEETPAGTEKQIESDNNDAANEVMLPGERSTGQLAIPRYSAVLAKYPYAVFFVTSLLIVICGLCSFVPQFSAPDIPEFSTPVKGFEPRGTLINKRYRAGVVLGKAASSGLVRISPIPNVTMSTLINMSSLYGHLTTPNIRQRKEQGREGSQRHFKNRYRLSMCDSPNVFMKSTINYKMVFASTTSGGNVFNSASLRAVCQMEEIVVRKTTGFYSNCFKRELRYKTFTFRDCCPSWSVGNYIAALSGRSSCQDISSNDVEQVLSILRHCAPLFNNATIKENCWNFKYNIAYPVCLGLPLECVRYNAVHNILYYLTDKDFFAAEGENLIYTSVLSPATSNKEFRKKLYEKHIKNGHLSDGNVKLVATEFYFLKFDMFNIKLLADIIYPSIAMLIILLIMWFYTESVLLTVLLVLSVVSALIIAYFLYTIVLGLNFFPFLNITTLIFLVGIGADDAFVFTDVWRQAKQNNPGAPLTRITADTLRHASLSMFVTSLTTAAAFIANFSSKITTIKCFGIYAGIAILCKFSMMVTWFPAVCVINESVQIPWPCAEKSSIHKIELLYQNYVAKSVRFVFSDFLPRVVIKFRIFWILSFSVLTLGGLEVLLFKPGFHLPTSSDFQMFESSHPLEAYELHFKDRFRFETSSSQGSATFPIDFFWGIKPVDNGDYLDPNDYGTIEWDESFDITSRESQAWLMNFCRKLRKQDFYGKKEGVTSYCFLETFYNQSCTDPLTPGISYYPCCKGSPFPFNKTILNLCATIADVRAQIFKYKRQDSTIGNLIYDERGSLRGIHLRVMSNVRISRAYEPAHQFWERTESWVMKEIRNAPKGMRGGWWISGMEFYDLQRSLSTGTLVSMAIAIAMAFGVMLLTTLNILVSLYAILTIIGIISVTIGSLVLSGWKLNILESITMSVAVGVSIDFAMHFGVAYCLAPNKECRKARVRFSLSRMGSAITMAAVTTFIAGAMMLPSRVLSYLQMGHFLMLVMTLGWAFSTFFFQALCCTIGPQGDWGQFSWSDIFSWRSMKTSEETPTREETVLLREHCEADENDNKNGTVESKIMVNNTQIKAIEATPV